MGAGIRCTLFSLDYLNYPIMPGLTRSNPHRTCSPRRVTGSRSHYVIVSLALLKFPLAAMRAQARLKVPNKGILKVQLGGEQKRGWIWLSLTGEQRLKEWTVGPSWVSFIFQIIISIRTQQSVINNILYVFLHFWTFNVKLTPSYDYYYYICCKSNCK